MARSVGGSGLDPDHVYSLFRRGDRSALFLYLASIRGAVEDPHCHGIWQAGWALGTPPPERSDLGAGSSPTEEHALGAPPPESIPCDSRKSARGGPLEVEGSTGVSCDSRKPAHAEPLEFDGSTGWYEDEDELIKLAEYAHWQAKSSSLCVSHVSGNAYSVPQKEKPALGGNKLPAKEEEQTPENVSAKGCYKHHIPEHKGSEKVLINSCEEKVSAKGGYKHHVPEHKGSENVLINSCEEKGQSLTEHPYVSVEVAEAELLCAIGRRDSRRKKITNHRAELQLLGLNMQHLDALSKEEKTSNIKKMRFLSEKIKGEEKMCVLDDEDVHMKQDTLDRARLRSSGA